jgi:hypothetical protein
MAAMPVGRNLDVKILETHAVVMPHRALERLTQDVFEIASAPQHEGATRLSGRDGKLGVVARAIDFGRGVVG